MIFETVITSVPRGLKAGRTGSQPVMRTRGLRDDLLNQLGPLAGYRHVHRQGSGQNPVIFSYRRLSSNIGDLAVIGRTVDAGSDFSNRSNKCGHLIAFTADEIGRLSRTTPAAILAGNASLFAAQWTKGPEERPTPPALVEPPQEPAVCTLWQQQFGDAGWAGLVAERARRRQPTMLVAPDCTPQSSELLLGLTREATALLSPGERWAVSFETTVLGSSDSLIQGTYRGSPEAEAPRPGMLVLPLGGPLPQTPLEETALCKLARFGKPRPATPVPPSVTGARSVPPGGDDFLGGDLPSTAPGSPPPLQRPTQGRDRTPFEHIPHDAGQPKSHLGMIAGGLTIVVVVLFLAGYAFVANLDLFWPEKRNEQAGQKAAAKQSPREVLNAYLAATHAKEPPADLAEPSIAVWREWLESMEVKDSIDEKWRSFANAVLRKCIRSEPNPFDTEWKQKERSFLGAVRNLSNQKPEIGDLPFLLLWPPPEFRNGDDSLDRQTANFTAAALEAYGRDSRDDEQIKPDDVIENTLKATAFYCDVTTFLATETDEEAAPKPTASDLASRWPSIPGLPPVTSERETADLQQQRRQHFFKSLLFSIQDGGKSSPNPTYGHLVERATAFKKSLTRLVRYATPNAVKPELPTLDDYATVYGDPSPHTIQELNAALQSLKRVPENLQDILKQANVLAAWQTLKKSFGATHHDNGELKIVLAKGIQYSEAIHEFIEPAFATPRDAITKWPNQWTVTVDQELCCTIEWDSDKSTLVADFTDKPLARALQSIPLVIHRKENGEDVDTTPPFRIRKAAIQYALQRDQVQQTAGSLAKGGETIFIEIRPSETNDPTNLKNIFSVLDKKDLTFTTTLSPEAEKKHIRVSATETTTTDGTFNFTYNVPTDTKRRDSKSYGPDVKIIVATDYSIDVPHNKMRFSTAGPALKSINLPSTTRSLNTNTVGGTEFTDIAHAAFSFSNANIPDLDAPARLKPVLIETTNLHAFGHDDDDPFGMRPIFGDESIVKNGKAEFLFSKNNFSKPNETGYSQPRALLGTTDAASLDKRSWEMTLASYLVKSSKVFVDKKKSFEAAEKALKTTEKTLASLKEDEKKNKEEIEEKEKEKRKQNRAKNEITDWFQGGWAKEDLPKIAENVRKQALKEETAEGRRKLVAAQIYLNLRPFLGKYLLANDEQVKDIPLASLLRTEIAYEPPPEFGEKFTIAVIEPARDSDRRDPRAPVDGPKPQAP